METSSPIRLVKSDYLAADQEIKRKSLSSASYFFFAGFGLGLSFVAGLGFGAGLGLGLSFGAGLGFGADLGFGLVAMLRTPINFFGRSGIYIRNF